LVELFQKRAGCIDGAAAGMNAACCKQHSQATASAHICERFTGFRQRIFTAQKAQEGSQNSPVGCFGAANPRKGFPDAALSSIRSAHIASLSFYR